MALFPRASMGYAKGVQHSGGWLGSMQQSEAGHFLGLPSLFRMRTYRQPKWRGLHMCPQSGCTSVVRRA